MFGVNLIKHNKLLCSILKYSKVFPSVHSQVIKHFVIAPTKCTIQINKPTRCNSLTSLLLDVLCRSTSFRCLHAHYQDLTTALTASGFTLERDDSRIVGRGLARPRPTTLLPPSSKVKPEAVNPYPANVEKMVS